MRPVFTVGQNSLEVIQTIIQNQPTIESITLISHKVSKNWRQIHTTSEAKVNFIKESLKHTRPINTLRYSREEFCKLSLEHLPSLHKDEVWSLISKVQCNDGIVRHIPLMNFHPIDISTNELINVIKEIRPNIDAALLSSDRFYHYYENNLLTTKQWVQFMTDFLMPCILVSPRYIGHRLHDEYCSLRITKAQQFKVKQPKVIAIL